MRMIRWICIVSMNNKPGITDGELRDDGNSVNWSSNEEVD